MEVEYTAVFEQVPRSEGGGYCAYVEELPGANTQGGTLEEARANLREAIQLVLQARRDLLHEQPGNHQAIREKIVVSVA